MSNILLIGPKFYGYEKSIATELECYFDEVFYSCEYPFGSIDHYSVISKIFPFLVKSIWEYYEKKILNIIKKNNINNVLIIRGAQLPETLIRDISLMEGMKMFHYQWDSVENNPNSLMIMKYSGANYTFDSADASRYPKFNYLPLFYDWRNCTIARLKKNIDVLYFGSWSNKRLELLSTFLSLCEERNLVMKRHIYMPFQTYIRLLLSGKGINKNILSFRTIGKKDYLALLEQSKAVLDVPSPSQKGMTMRTIEALSVGVKVISTNELIKKERFYSPENILVYPQEKNKIKEFLETPFVEYKDNEGVYSLKQWIHRIICV